MRRSVWVAVAVAWALSVVAAQADFFCEKKSGAVAIRSACKKKETQVDLASFGALGPKGDTGSKGDKGDAGANGTPGAAIAYAHVLSNGTVDAANSKNVTNANVTLDTFIVASAYCFHDLTFSFHNVVVVAGWDGLGSTGTFAQGAVGDPAGDCTSVGQAIVVTQTTAAFTPADFYIIFN
jgi:hypothetical protein